MGKKFNVTNMILWGSKIQTFGRNKHPLKEGRFYKRSFRPTNLTKLQQEGMFVPKLKKTC